MLNRLTLLCIVCHDVDDDNRVCMISLCDSLKYVFQFWFEAHTHIKVFLFRLFWEDPFDSIPDSTWPRPRQVAIMVYQDRYLFRHISLSGGPFWNWQSFAEKPVSFWNEGGGCRGYDLEGVGKVGDLMGDDL